MDNLSRRLRIELPRGQSAFLWGPRKAGKSTYLRASFPGAEYLDFLRSDLAFELARRPALLRERLEAQPEAERRRLVILDEVQKVPGLLDEVHWLIENRRRQFILCGSSARKLVRGGANLLGGRAWRYEMFPLVSDEIGDVDLLQALNRGLLPSHYFSEQYRRSLDAYVIDYLKEEVFAEGLTRNVPAFSRFFDAAGLSNGELVNHAAIARDCGIDGKTVKEYFQILCDTLLGRFVPPFKKRKGRQVVSKAAKFYFFDVGVAGRLVKRTITEEKGEQFGRALEHFIFMELAAHASYTEAGYDITFSRTKAGLEVDFILGDGEVAIEVKGQSRVDDRDLRGLRAFVEDHRPKRAIVVCNEPAPRVAGGLTLLPWREFLRRLWAGEVVG